MKAEDLFEKVTADLVTAIEDGAKDWRMPWHRLAASGLPRSVDGRPYRTGALRVSERRESEWCGRVMSGVVGAL